MSDNRIYRECVRVIILKGSEVLLGTRVFINGNASCYEFPGGGVKIGETKEEACVRECLEEVGIRVKDIVPLDIIVKHDIRYFDNVRASKYKGGIDHWYVCKFDSVDHSLHGLERDPLSFTWETPNDAIDSIVELAKRNFSLRKKLTGQPVLNKYDSVRVEALEAVKHYLRNNS